jgi:hypothetical protein
MGETPVFAAAGDWAVGTDGIQWILYHRRSRRLGGWYGVSFVRTERGILARCMREKGVDADTARLLLSGLPDTFDQWKSAHAAPDRPAAPLQEAAEALASGGLQREVADAR